MAGFSNPKFLAPSHFTKPDKDPARKTTADGTKPVLLPPSTYEKHETFHKSKIGSKVQPERTKIVEQKGDHKPALKSLQKTADLAVNEEFLNDELQKAKRKISELQREIVILQEESQDKNALSEVVCQLKRDLKRSREKLNLTEKACSGKGQEYLDMRSKLHETDRKYSNLKQNYSKLVEDLRLSDETNCYLKRKIETRDLEFECVVRAKEQEICEAVAKLKEVSAEGNLKADMLTQMEGKCKTLSEEKRQATDEHDRIMRDKMRIEEEFNRLQIDKDRMEGDLRKSEEEKRKFQNDFERLCVDVSKMEQQRHGIEQDRARLHEEKVRIMEDIGRSEENLKKIEEGFLNEKKKCSTLLGEIEEKDSVISDLRAGLSLNEEQLSRVELECRARVDEIEHKCKMKMTQLENEIHSKDQILCEERKEYQDNLLQKDEEVRSLSKTVEQLRSYIGEIRPSREVEKLSENNEELTNNLRALTEENNVLTSTMKLLNVRLAAISEIVSIQEAELSRHGGVAGCVGDRRGVLSTWREKVFALMVQLQSQKIVENETKQKETAKFESLNVKFQESERSISILNHKLADQEAAVELEVNKRVKLTEEKEKFLAENDVLKKRQKQWSTQIQALHRSTRTVEGLVATTLSCLNKAVGKIASFDQRLKFASSRILFISEFLSHRGSQKKSMPCDAMNQDSQTNDESSRENEEHLRSEVQKLLKERAVLLNETKKHNQTLQEKTSALQEHYETMIEEKNIHIEKLQISESENKQRLYSLQEQADTKCQELEEAAETIEELKLSLSKEKTTIEEEHRKAMEEERLKNAEDLAVLEKQLSDARREHTKTVAALRNSERQTSREKQQASNMVANIEKEYGERLARVEKRLKDVEKERNLLMVRIREDRSNVVRSRPVSGKDNGVPNGYAVMKKQEKSSEESVAKGKSEANIMQAKDGVERVDTIDAVDALTALKEIKVLSQQIVRLHGKNNEVSASDSEL